MHLTQFIDRAEELQTLENEYQRPGSALVILYGRRRVGKTTLITEFIKDKPALFFLASEEPETQNRTLFRQKAAEFTGNPLLEQANITSWDIIFQTIIHTSFSQKPVIVIDEFQYLGKVNPAFPSIFQRIWEEILKEKSIMVILCGSLISMMESQTLAYSSPLYGRRTAQIRLKQIPFRYYNQFFTDNTPDLIERYAVTGGVPKYIELFSDATDIYDGIARHILNRSGYLYDEPYFLLQQEVSEVGSYFAILKTIASGNHKLSDIAKVLEIKQTNLTKYLKTLIDLDILEREIPITEENPEKSKKGLYQIKDNYIRFWFAFIYPNRNFIETGNSTFVMNKIRNHIVEHHIAFVYEDICREAMWELNAKDFWPFYFSKVGRYWNTTTEIDIVALDPDDKNIIFGECKYWKEPVGINILSALKEKTQQVDWNKGARTEWFVLFSKAGFTEELQALAKNSPNILLIEEYLQVL